MYFTESPHLQSIEAAMKMIPRHPLIQDAKQKGSSMKLKFLSEDSEQKAAGGEKEQRKLKYKKAIP